MVFCSLGASSLACLKVKGGGRSNVMCSASTGQTSKCALENRSSAKQSSCPLRPSSSTKLVCQDQCVHVAICCREQGCQPLSLTLYWNSRGSTLRGMRPRRWLSTSSCTGGQGGGAATNAASALENIAQQHGCSLGQQQLLLHVAGRLHGPRQSGPPWHVKQARPRVYPPAPTWMTDVLFTMNTCSMAMVGVSLIMMRRSELATCKQQVHHQPAISYRTIWRAAGGSAQHARAAAQCRAIVSADKATAAHARWHCLRALPSLASARTAQLTPFISNSMSSPS